MALTPESLKPVIEQRKRNDAVDFIRDCDYMEKVIDDVLQVPSELFIQGNSVSITISLRQYWKLSIKSEVLHEVERRFIAAGWYNVKIKHGTDCLRVTFDNS